MMKSFGYWFLKYDDKDTRVNYKNSAEDYRNYKYNVQLHYSHVLKKWVTYDEYLNDGDTIHTFPSCIKCNSIKAAKAHLRRHTEIPNGTRFVLVGKYVGQKNVVLTKRGA